MRFSRRLRHFAALCTALAAAAAGSAVVTLGLVAPGLAAPGLAAQGLAAQGLAAQGVADSPAPLVVSVTSPDGSQVLAGHQILIKRDADGNGRPDETVLELTSAETPQAVSGFDLGRFWIEPGVPLPGYRHLSQPVRFSTDQTNHIQLRVEPVVGRQETSITVVETPKPAGPAVTSTIPGSSVSASESNPSSAAIQGDGPVPEDLGLVVKAARTEPPDRRSTASRLLAFVPEDTRRQVLKLIAFGAVGFGSVLVLGLVIRRRLRPKDSAAIIVATVLLSGAIAAAASRTPASADQTEPGPSGNNTVSGSPIDSGTGVASALGLANNSMAPWVDVRLAGNPDSMVIADRLPWGLGDRSVVLSTGKARHAVTGSPMELASTSWVQGETLTANPRDRVTMTLTTGAFTRDGRNDAGDPAQPPACFVLRFTLLSEEYPEYVLAGVADTFSVSAKDGQTGTIQGGPNVVSVDSVEWRSDPVGRFDGRSATYGMVIPNTTEQNGSLSNWQRFTFVLSDVGDTLYDTAVVLDDLRYVSDQTRCDGLVLPRTLDDADGDGLFDHWERVGADADFDGSVDLPIHEMGADPLRHDLFVVLEASPERTPEPLAIGAVVERFASLRLANPDGSTGVSLHIIDQPEIPISQSAAAERPIAWRDFQVRRASVLAGAMQSLVEYWWIVPKVHGADAWGGVGGFVTQNFTPEVAVHEWGHGLGLSHSGPDDAREERKPNHWSLMNAVFLFGTGDSAGMDFTNFTPTTLDEKALVETDGIGPADRTTDLPVFWACPDGQWVTDDNPADGVDWDCDQTLSTTPVAVDINDSGTLAVLTGVNEWAEAQLGMSGGRWWNGT